MFVDYLIEQDFICIVIYCELKIQNISIYDDILFEILLHLSSFLLKLLWG